MGSRGVRCRVTLELGHHQPAIRSPAGSERLNPVTGLPAPLRIPCCLTSGNRICACLAVLS